MRIFFTTSYDSKTVYQSYSNEIVRILNKNGVHTIMPENSPNYHEALRTLKTEGLNAHYAYITHGIAEADVVIIEASHEDFRLGHEATLALLYSKPTLILSQHVDYSNYIPHELLFGCKYHTKAELRTAVQHFLDQTEDYLVRATESAQTIGNAADSLHLAALTVSRHNALQDLEEFGVWARLAEKNSDKAYVEIQKALGHLPIGKAWSAFAAIYNEDTPDYIFSGEARFIRTVFNTYGIKNNDPIGNAAGGTGGLSRNLVNLGYRNIAMFDNSREMLAEAFRLCAHLPSIKLFEGDLATARFETPVRAIAWTDYRSNFAMDAHTLGVWVMNLLQNITQDGCLVFDIRTETGWQVDFYQQKVTTFATRNFQRIWINLPDYANHTISFDIFIRTKQPDGKWSEWQREQMQERMWSLSEVTTLLQSIPECSIDAVYGDSFQLLKDNQEPGLAYIVLSKAKR